MIRWPVPRRRRPAPSRRRSAPKGLRARLGRSAKGGLPPRPNSGRSAKHEPSSKRRSGSSRHDFKARIPERARWRRRTLQAPPSAWRVGFAPIQVSTGLVPDRHWRPPYKRVPCVASGHAAGHRPHAVEAPAPIFSPCVRRTPGLKRPCRPWPVGEGGSAMDLLPSFTGPGSRMNPRVEFRRTRPVVSVRCRGRLRVPACRSPSGTVVPLRRA